MSTASQRRRGGFGRLLITLLLLAGLVVAAGWAIRRSLDGEPQQQAALPVFNVVEGPLAISVTVAGTIRPRDQVIIKSELEGRTTILSLVAEGTRVKQGDLLVELDASSLQDSKVDQEIRVQNAEADFIQDRENVAVVKNLAQSEIEKAKLALTFAREDLTQYEKGEYPKLLMEHEAKITLAQEEIQRAAEKLQWSKVLFDEKYLSQSELQADELAAKKAKLEFDLADSNLQLLKDYTYRRRMAELESDVRQAEMALERVERKASADVVQAEAKLRARESEYGRQQDKLAKLGEQIGKARIIAPTDGLVVYATSARASWRGNNEPLAEGQDVHERQELIHLPTASTFIAELKVHESSLDKIRLGLPARLSVDALPGQTFTGRVAKIAPLPDAQSVFMNPDLKVYETTVEIDGGADLLRTGMTCEVTIIVETYAQALSVPVQCVVRVHGKPTVFVGTGTDAVPRAVEIGLDNNRMVHIKSGLQAGEPVLLTPPLQSAAAEPMTVEVEVPPAPAGAPSAVTPSPAATPVPSPTENSAAGAGETADAAERPRQRPDRSSMSEEDRARMRERWQNMSPEERERLRERSGRGRRGADGDQ